MSDPAPHLAAGMNLPRGDRLGPYEIVAPLGAGGMGEVYRARDTRLGREVAIKIISDRLAQDPKLLRRFEQEAKAIASLSHPNILAIHDFNTENGISFAVMELLRGESLADRLARERLSWRKAVKIAAAVADGLASAHGHGVVHRDLKPANIFLTHDGQVKILDFGLAKRQPTDDSFRSSIATESQPGLVVGTIGYMAPEQVSGAHVDARADIFALGCILYEMISGERAFTRPSAGETLAAILRDNPRDLSESGRAFPPAIAQIIRRCLQKSPDERFQSARDLAFDLETAAQPSRFAPTISRRAIISIATAATALLLIGISVIYKREGDAARPKRIMSTTNSARQTGSTFVKSVPLRRTFALLTNRAGLEEFPSLAPDGKTFVYVSSAAGNPDIYLQRVDGWKTINLTRDSPVADTQPAFSPDGSQIAFRSEREGGGIFLMGATGESVRRLTDFGFNPTWSPDGSEIAVSNESVEVQPHIRPRAARIAIINVRTGAQRDLPMPDGLQPSWSPHGDRIAYWALKGSGGQRDLYTIEPHAAHPETTITQLMDDAPLDWNPVWSPDGKFIYFGSDRDGTMNLWRIPVDEHSGKALGPPGAVSLPTRFAAHFTIARETGALAYAGVDLSETLWRVPFDSQSLRVTGDSLAILGGAMRVLDMVEVSPDGKWLAFSNIGPQEDLFVMRSDGSEMRQLTNDPEKDRGPSWSADGKLLYFFSQRGPTYEVWSIRVDGSGLRQVSRTAGPSLLWPRVTPDGKALYGFLSSGGAALLPLNPDGTATKVDAFPPMPDPRSHFLYPRLSPDGSRLVGNTIPVGLGFGTSRSSVWLYSIARKSYEKLADDGTMPQWLPDGKHVLFVSRTQLKVIDVTSKQSRTIPLPRPIDGFAVAPDGRALYLCDRPAEADIWMMSSH